MSHQQLTASSITDPQLDDLLAELDRLRAAVALHAPERSETAGPVLCRACRAEIWPCPTVRAAGRPASVIAGQSRADHSASSPGLIAPQSAATALLPPTEVIAPQSGSGAE